MDWNMGNKVSRNLPGKEGEISMRDPSRGGAAMQVMIR
jgi:hypothetical protein